MLKHVLKRVSPAGGDGRLSTLIFHRVLPEIDPLFPGETDAARFDAVCRWIKSWFNVLPLDEAVKRLAHGDLPERALTITFDDGYADNHDLAMPILARHGLTATFFIATGFLDGGRMWNDTVIETVRLCRLPVLDLSGLVGDRLGALALGDDASRRRAIDTILGAIKYLPVDERLAITMHLVERAGVTLPDDLMMTSEQVRALRRGGMQIGAHTVSHPILAVMSDDAARAEMQASKHRLEVILDEPVELFAYPNGRPESDFTDRTVALARDIGFTAAVSTAKGAAAPGSDLFRIPRFTPWDRSRMRFGARLAGNLWSARGGSAS